MVEIDPYCQTEEIVRKFQNILISRVTCVNRGLVSTQSDIIPEQVLIFIAHVLKGNGVLHMCRWVRPVCPDM